MAAPLRILFEKGVRYSTVIDVGCADGHFFLNHFTQGYFAGAMPLNIDANTLYEGSLRDIQSVVGGHYKIAAITDHEGEIELTTSEHPYWASLRPQGDLYWQRINKLSGTDKRAVAATTLDTLVGQLSLQPPFLLKLDVQGAEVPALRGASRILQNTHVVICEADLDDFQDINSSLVDSGFFLYDAIGLQRTPDGTLGWFYPIYVNQVLDFVRPKSFWDPKDNAAVVHTQVERRKAILRTNADVLNRLRLRTAAPSAPLPSGSPRRNELCSCGSGLKYKHCCGKLA
jgi:FkbM family methyltransferase